MIVFQLTSYVFPGHLYETARHYQRSLIGAKIDNLRGWCCALLKAWNNAIMPKQGFEDDSFYLCAGQHRSVANDNAKNILFSLS